MIKKLCDECGIDYRFRTVLNKELCATCYDNMRETVLASLTHDEADVFKATPVPFVSIMHISLRSQQPCDFVYKTLLMLVDAHLAGSCMPSGSKGKLMFGRPSTVIHPRQ